MIYSNYILQSLIPLCYKKTPCQSKQWKYKRKNKIKVKKDKLRIEGRKEEKAVF